MFLRLQIKVGPGVDEELVADRQPDRFDALRLLL
jgi:hypothetical protein